MMIGDIYWCDAEIGKPGDWHSCKRHAAIAVVAASGVTIHYCERHKARINNPRFLVKAALAEPTALKPGKPGGI